MRLILYVTLCLIVGWVGHARKPGFIGYFLLSILFTPVLPLLFILLTHRRFLRKQRRLTMSGQAPQN